jgi:hypothetical protein
VLKLKCQGNHAWPVVDQRFHFKGVKLVSDSAS